MRNRGNRSGISANSSLSGPSHSASVPQLREAILHAKIGSQLCLPEGPVQRLEGAMQAGFGRAAAEQLEQLKFTLSSADLADAAWAIAYWNRLNDDYRRALDHLLIRRLADPHVLWGPAAYRS